MEHRASELAGLLSNPVAILVIVAVLIAYRIVASRTHKLPPVPVSLLVIYLLLRLILGYLPETESPGPERWLDIISIIVLYCAIFRILFTLTIDYWCIFYRHTHFPKITRDFILVAVYALIAFIVLRTRGDVNLVGLLTTSAVLTAVIGLAAQNTLGNLFAGISLQLERPYGIGDWIQYGDSTGQVVAIGWKSTRLRTFEREIVFVPNMDIAKSVLKNFSSPSKLHVMKIDIGLEYGAAPNRVRQVILDALRDEPRVVKTPAPIIRVMDYGDFAITYQIRVMYDDYGTYPVLRGDIMNRLWYALRRNNIKIPFPIRDVELKHVERRFDFKRREAQKMEARQDLDTVPILAPLAAEQRDMISDRMGVEDYGAGETIVYQGDAGDSMYILHSGSCDVLVQNGDAPAVCVATLAPPAFFGEMSLLTGDARTATVKAAEDSRLFAINKVLFGEVLTADPSISGELAKALAARQAENAARLGKKQEDSLAQSSKILSRIKGFFGIS